MEKLVKIEDTEIGLKVSAGTVRAYRDMFGRDLILDIGNIEKEILDSKTMSSETASIAEQAIWLMAKEYDDETLPLKEWLDQFSPYFIYTAIVSVIAMWTENTKTLIKSKKN